MTSLSTPANTSQHDTGEDLERIVRATRRRLRVHWFLAGIALWLVVTLGLLLLMIGVDVLTPLAVWMRVVFCTLWGIATLGTFSMAVAWPVLHPPSLWAVAHRIEQTVDQMHNRLISVLDLRQRESPSQLAGQAFFVRLLEQTRQRMMHFQVARVVSQTRLRNAAGMAFGVACLLAALYFLFPLTVPTAASRILLPTADIPPATWVRFETPADVEVLQGESATLTATLSRGTLEAMELHLREADGKWHRYPMQQVSPTVFSFEIDHVSASQSFRFVGGGTWTPLRTIRAVRRPVISDVQMHLELPAYTRKTQGQPIAKDVSLVKALPSSMLNVTAHVQGDAVSGRVKMFELVAETKTQTVEKRRAWIEDQYPSDSQVIGNAQWLTHETLSGSHALLVQRTQPSGFITNLETFTISPDTQLSWSLLIPQGESPTSLSISFMIDGQWRKLVLLDEATFTAMRDRRDEQFFAVGKLPEPGVWTEMSIAPVTLLRSDSKEDVVLSGITFQLDQDARLYVDRIGTRWQETVMTTEMTEKPLGKVTFVPGREAQTWQSSVPIDRDFYMQLEFENHLGHASQPTEPLRIEVQQDQPASIFIERPTSPLTLNRAEPVAVVARGFDDYGIASVALRAGRSASTLETVRDLEVIDGVETSKLIMATLRPDAMGLRPGETLLYQLVIMDTKGQVTPSKLMRLAMDAHDLEQSSYVVAQKNASLQRAIDALAEAMRASNLLTDLPEQLLAELLRQSEKPAGEAMQPKDEHAKQRASEQLQQKLDAELAKLSDAQRDALWQAEQQLDQQQDKLREASEQLAAAKRLEDASPMSTQASKDTLEQLQDALQNMSAQTKGTKVDRKITPRELKAMAKLRQDASKLKSMRDQLEAMQQAQQQSSKQPHDPQQHKQLQKLMAQMQANRAQRDMQQLANTLKQHQKKLDEQARQQQQLNKQTQQADNDEKLAKASKQQQQLDPKSLQAIRETQRLLDEKLEGDVAHESTKELAPWRLPEESQPKTETHQQPQTPTEQKKPNGQEAQPASDHKKPKTTQTHKDKLEQHQGDMLSALKEKSSDLKEKLNEVAELEAELEDLKQQLATQDAPKAQAPKSEPQPGSEPKPAKASEAGKGKEPSKSQEPSQASEPGASPGEASKPNSSAKPTAAKPSSQQAAQKLEQLMNSPKMQQAQAMAKRAQALHQGKSNSNADPQQSSGQASQQSGSDPGALLSMELDDLPADQREKLYRLPPSIRQPLIRAMKQRGPAGYQPLIDAYYRELTQEQQ